MNCWICDPFDVYFFCILLLYELLYILCRRVMLCASSVPQVSIFVLYIDGCANYIASLYRIGVGALQVGIRAGLPVGNPFFWSMSSLVKIIYNLTMSCENLLRILFTPHPTRSTLILIFICFMLGVDV